MQAAGLIKNYLSVKDLGLAIVLLFLSRFRSSSSSSSSSMVVVVVVVVVCRRLAG